VRIDQYFNHIPTPCPRTRRRQTDSGNSPQVANRGAWEWSALGRQLELSRSVRQILALARTHVPCLIVARGINRYRGAGVEGVQYLVLRQTIGPFFPASRTEHGEANYFCLHVGAKLAGL
jgi:hypothetical protein